MPILKSHLSLSMLSLSLLATIALVPFAAAQTALDIAGIKAHFNQSAIVPDLLASFNPSAVLSLNFPGKYDFRLHA